MSAPYTARARWVMAAVIVACFSALVLTGARQAAAPAPSPAPGGGYANRSAVFGLIKPGPTPDVVLFAPARKVQPAGPETVYPADIGRYVPLALAPGAVIRASAPIANEGVTDWVRGIRLTPEQFARLLRQLFQRPEPVLDRAHMFTLWFDGRGRITRMQHYFSP